MDSLADVLQSVYDCEVNVKIQTMWDGGYEIFIGGSPMDEFKAGSIFGTCETASELAATIALLLYQKFPHVLQKRSAKMFERLAMQEHDERLRQKYGADSGDNA